MHGPLLGTAEALERILERAVALREVQAVALQDCVGRVLARPVESDVDLPPFEKSAMDGYAVHAADFVAGLAPAGERTLPILGESRAGAPFEGEVPAGECVAIYTGAEVPRGCDAVVMVEVATLAEDGSRVRLADRPRPGQNICNRGQDLARGQQVLVPGRRIRAVDLAALASVGCQPVPVYRRPRVAVVTSGDELVTPEREPGVGQIRESNTLQLAALCTAAGAEALNLGIVRDDPGELERAFAGALEGCDALVTTGGVSMGKYDLVGAALEKLGAEPLFHRVAIKPGKPLWFGVRGGVPVFALPGNPVSCLVNHELFVRPALRRMGGETVFQDPLRRGRWEGQEVAANPREQYLPSELSPGEDGVERLSPVRWNGSADVVGISRAEALAVVAPGSPLARGELVPFRPLR